MNLNTIRPKNGTKGFLLSITKNCESLIHQIHIRPEETLEFRMFKPRETIRFNAAIQVEGDWMLGLIYLEVYNYIFNINITSNKLELYTVTFDEFSFKKRKD